MKTRGKEGEVSYRWTYGGSTVVREAIYFESKSDELNLFVIYNYTSLVIMIVRNVLNK